MSVVDLTWTPAFQDICHTADIPDFFTLKSPGTLRLCDQEVQPIAYYCLPATNYISEEDYVLYSTPLSLHCCCNLEKILSMFSLKML